MLQILPFVGFLSFGWLAYAFWYAGHDHASAGDLSGTAGKKLVS